MGLVSIQLAIYIASAIVQSCARSLQEKPARHDVLAIKGGSTKRQFGGSCMVGDNQGSGSKATTLIS